MSLESIIGGSFTGTKIAGVGRCVPEQGLSNDDLSKMVDTNDAWIIQRTGIGWRPILDKSRSTSDMAAAACKEALKDAGVKAKKVGCLILATTTADKLIPATAPAVAHMIGMETTAAAFDLNAGCSGGIYTLAVADSLIRSGLFEDVLVVGAETLSRRVDYTDRSTCILFGDGAGAVYMKKSNTPVMPMYFSLGSDGGKVRLLNIPAGGAKKPATADDIGKNEDKLHMSGKELSPIGVAAMARSMRQVLEKSGHSLGEVDHIITHQMNLRMIETLISHFGRKEKLNPAEVIVDIQKHDDKLVAYNLFKSQGKNGELKVRVPVNISRIGNTSAASIFILLSEAEEAGVLQRNQKLLITAVGAGLTWGSGILKWKEDSNEPSPIKVFDRARSWLGTSARRVFFFYPFNPQKISTEGEN